MSEPRDPLFDAIRAAGEVPPPPDRDAAFARAMQPVLLSPRRRLNRSFIALFVAAMVAVPAAVFAARATHAPTAVVAPIAKETADPGGPLTHEADDSRSAHESEHSTEPSASSRTDDHSGSSTTSSSDDTHHLSGGDSSGPSSVGGSDSPNGEMSPTPTPTPLESNGSGSSGGGMLSGDGGSAPSSSPTPDGSSSPGPH